MRVFFSEDDYRSYTTLLARQARRHALDIWAYSLMPNHVHLIGVPSSKHGSVPDVLEMLGRIRPHRANGGSPRSTG